MASVEKSIEVEVPVKAAYNQWTQFEQFPRFMEGVKAVEQRGDDLLHWIAEVGGKKREWDARITEQLPDHRIAWTSTEGDRNAGVVTFHRLEPNKTKIMLQVDYEPEGAAEHLGDVLGVMDRRIQGDLKRFKEFVEAGTPTGGWAGAINN